MRCLEGEPLVSPTFVSVVPQAAHVSVHVLMSTRLHTCTRMCTRVPGFPVYTRAHAVVHIRPRPHAHGHGCI